MKNALSRLVVALSTVVVAVMGIVAITTADTMPTVSVTPSSTSYSRGDTVQLAVQLHPNGTPLNTVNVVVQVPTDKLAFVGLDKSASYFDTFVPSNPTVAGSTLTFAAASLAHGSTSSTVTVATLLFKAIATSGSATISFNGTQVANGGTAIDTSSSPLTLVIGGTGSSSSSNLTITGSHVMALTTQGATISWTTNVPTTGIVDYGSSTRYGQVLSSSTASTSHSVTLTGFSGKSAVHYRITAEDSSANVLRSKDLQFITAGYPIRVHVIDSADRSMANVLITIDGVSAGSTDSSGQLTVQNVAPGSRNVRLGDGKTQVILVKAEVGSQASTVQSFTLHYLVSHVLLWIVLTAIVVATLLGSWFVYLQHREAV